MRVRRTNTAKVFDLLALNFGRWVKAERIAKVGGFCAWRTRLSDARKLCDDDSEIVWNNNQTASAYMLRPKRLGRDASQSLPQRSLF